MTSELDKLTYSTTYRQDYGTVSRYSGVDLSVESGKVDCKAKVFAGSQKGYTYQNPLNTCPCRPGGNMPPRGAAVSGAPTNLDKECGCKRAGAVTHPAPNKEKLAEMMYKGAETGIVKEDYTSCHNRSDLIPPKQPKAKSIPYESLPCPENEKLRPLLPGQFGERYEEPLNKESADETKHPEQATPSSSYKPCICPPSRPESGPQEYGQMWLRERSVEKPVEIGMMGETAQSVPLETTKRINPELPSGRVSCAPEVDIAKYDQPNSFMRKLYDKYPYLYQILRDTPPEELITRVFKDRFLSTYQVDYLHMGVGKEQFPKSGDMVDKFVSPDTGEEEPKMIPGHIYPPSKKANFGKKKSDLKTREYEEEDREKVKEESRVSEYMASISKLGGEIITDKLYKLEIENRKQIQGKDST